MFDAKGKRLAESVTWTSGNEAKASHRPANQIAAKEVGPVRVFAKAGGVRQSFSLEVVPAATVLKSGDGVDRRSGDSAATARTSPTAKKS